MTTTTNVPAWAFGASAPPAPTVAPRSAPPAWAPPAVGGLDPTLIGPPPGWADDMRTMARRSAEQRAPSVVLVAAHGGCGASTLAEHLVGARELEWPAIPGRDAPSPGEGLGALCVVASTTPDGARAAANLLYGLHDVEWTRSRLRLVFVHDGRGPVPVSVRARGCLLHPAVASIYLLPHVARWRYQAREDRTPSRRYAQAVHQLAAAVGAPQVSGQSASATGHRSARPHSGTPARDDGFASLPRYPVPAGVHDGRRPW